MSAAAVRAAIRVVGADTSGLAEEMIPYHVRAYAELEARQKAIYGRLVVDRLKK